MASTSSGITLNVPTITEAAVTPTQVNTGASVKITAKVEIVSKWFAAEELYSGEIYAGEA